MNLKEPLKNERSEREKADVPSLNINSVPGPPGARPQSIPLAPTEIESEIKSILHGASEAATALRIRLQCVNVSVPLGWSPENPCCPTGFCSVNISGLWSCSSGSWRSRRNQTHLKQVLGSSGCFGEIPNLFPPGAGMDTLGLD
ncbi:unnamed protein product [Leuciscus chuanchicus]